MSNLRCSQCEAMMINGVHCHESGCPNTHKIKVDGEWLTQYECRECGSKYTDQDQLSECCQ